VRTRRHEPAAAKSFDLACEKWERAEEVWNAMEWNLARDPKVGHVLSESGSVRAYLIQGAQSVGWPTLTVIYTIEAEDLIVIHEATFETAGHYQAGNA
jgi:hypothetical protein